MADILLRSLAFNLAFTLAVEEAAGFVMGVRAWRDALLVALVNVITNPPLGLLLDWLTLRCGLRPGPLFWVIFLVCEAAVAAAEGLLYRRRLACGADPWKFSAVLNAASCLGGILYALI